MWVNDSTILNIIILSCCGLGLLYAIINALMIRSIRINPSSANFNHSYNKFHDEEGVSDNKLASLLDVGDLIARVKKKLKNK